MVVKSVTSCLKSAWSHMYATRFAYVVHTSDFSHSRFHKIWNSSENIAIGTIVGIGKKLYGFPIFHSYRASFECDFMNFNT